MAISGKPKKSSPAVESIASPSEQEVFNLINKGGSVAKLDASQEEPENIKPMLVQLRLYPDLVEEIDATRLANKGKGKRSRPPSRHAWIVSAIEEKLARSRDTP